MSYKVKTIPVFEKQTKKLAKKYASLRSDIEELVEKLTIQPIDGTPLGKNCFKIRLQISAKKKGKSGGARVITTVVVLKETVYLLTIFDKSEKDAISDKELIELLSFLPD